MIPKIRGRKERVRGTIAGVSDHHKPFLTGRWAIMQVSNRGTVDP
jgi:hypothetical protein